MTGAKTVWLKKRGAELKNVEQSSARHPHNMITNSLTPSTGVFSLLLLPKLYCFTLSVDKIDLNSIGKKNAKFGLLNFWYLRPKWPKTDQKRHGDM